MAWYVALTLSPEYSFTNLTSGVALAPIVSLGFEAQLYSYLLLRLRLILRGVCASVAHLRPLDKQLGRNGPVVLLTC